MLFFGFGAVERLGVALGEGLALDETPEDGETCRGLATGVGVMVAAGPDCSGARVLNVVLGAADGRPRLTAESDDPPHPATSAAATKTDSTARYLLPFAMALPRCVHEPLGASHVWSR